MGSVERLWEPAISDIVPCSVGRLVNSIQVLMNLAGEFHVSSLFKTPVGSKWNINLHICKSLGYSIHRGIVILFHFSLILNFKSIDSYPSSSI